VSPADDDVSVGAPLRVLALVIAAGSFAVVGWLVAHAWWLFTDGLAGRVPMNKSTISTFLLIVVFLLPMIHRLWRVARSGVDPEPERKVIDAIESRALLEAVERHDRLRMDAQGLVGEEVGGVLNAESRPSSRDPHLDEPTGRGDEARIDARTKERGAPG
jgi:hypothetical protein